MKSNGFPFWQSAVILGCSAMSNAALAQSQSQTKSKITSRSESSKIEQNQADLGFTLFFGADFGLLNIESRIPYETKRTGNGILAKAAGSFYTQNFVFDLGLGWMYTSFSGTDIKPEVIDVPVEGGDPGESDEQVIDRTTNLYLVNQTGFLEFSPRFRIGKGFQIGPTFVYSFGANFSFAPDEQGAKSAFFIGPQLFYGFLTKSFDFRIGASYLTDLTIPDRQLHLYMLCMQFGIPFVRPDVIIQESRMTTVKEKVEKKEVQKVVEKVVEKVVVREVSKYDFSSTFVNFSGDRRTLDPRSQAFALELGKFLNERFDNWQALKIEAPTIEMAQALRNVLVSAGLPASRIPAAVAHSNVSPGGGSSRWIELYFIGIKDPSVMNEGFTRVRRRFSNPETCGTGGCK
jgi:hypothetical protein